MSVNQGRDITGDHGRQANQGPTSVLPVGELACRLILPISC